MTAPDSTTLLKWYDKNSRSLPWRTSPQERGCGINPNPYHVWLSEIMLQQTTVAAVRGYFEKFITLWPKLENLAEAEEEDLLKAWAGLGYYSRARNLHKCARELIRFHNGRFPEEEKRLLKLPGIGPYTAAAISTIAFNRHAAVVDGNVERVITRIFALTAELPKSRHQIKKYMHELTPHERPGDFAQAMMDLGATICKPRAPNCLLCPWRTKCDGYKSGIAESLPRKTPKPIKPTRHGMAFVVRRDDGSVLLRKRADKGLLAGMSEPPSTTWAETAAMDDLSLVPFKLRSTNLKWQRAKHDVKHTFTHFHLKMSVWITFLNEEPILPDGYWWSSIKMQQDEALPTVMKKALKASLNE
ncbi:A/G-specific adenine glycosylase [Flexibacterium corallicola]|uniref:A/G-specific adenine glycosylase n=1 Tax=Flexibacterium corallicola TaxID=3037259 RepID=UPI00286F8F28|nr:A/G-specific adenine glycosylase [Pseudovibrio sp. M1P-2-3]